jgi:hypothetical protein
MASRFQWIGRLAAALLLATPASALAWGNTGHRLAAIAATEALPEEVPAFLRSPEVAVEIGELSREPDRWRSAGRVHDGIRDPGHFIDVDDVGKILGGPELAALPATFIEYEAALRSAGTDSAKAGYLPYAIIDGWQQLTKDFALWRVAVWGEETEIDPARRAWLAADRQAREGLILRDLGVWAHYVTDAAYPPHVSVHFNGWGDYPNPRGYTTQKIHVPLEGPYVLANVSVEQVRAAMPPPRQCRCAVDLRVRAYLQANYALIEPFYQLEKDGGFAPGDARGPAFMAGRLGTGAAEVRDLVVDAWRMSEAMNVGYPPVTLADIKAGRITAYEVLYSPAD